MPDTIFVGIDVAKFKHTCCTISQEGEVKMRPFDFRNEGEGYSSLLKKLGDLGPKQTTMIGMESTGHYHENLVRRLKAGWLFGQGLQPEARRCLHQVREDRLFQDRRRRFADDRGIPLQASGQRLRG